MALMDLTSLKRGLPSDYFWNKGKLNLVRILFERVFSKGYFGEECKLLCVGVGTGDELVVLNKYGRVFAIDTNVDAINALPDQNCYEKKVGNVCNLAYPNDYFDAITAFDVLEYVDDDSLAINEINRVLKPGGVFIFTVPALPFLYSAHDRLFNHVRRYTINRMMLILSGMKCVSKGYWMFFCFPAIAYKKLMNRTGTKLIYTPLPSFINNVLYSIVNFENFLISHKFKMPIGTTIFGIYEKLMVNEVE
jgi:SAM-dependent methyltransferase|tara:strand:+ start:582 stop:1328 length:747 start_codon:yes stop_codon:yes gene_type:complete